jgi:hypothetical protein
MGYQTWTEVFPDDVEDEVVLRQDLARGSETEVESVGGRFIIII